MPYRFEAGQEVFWSVMTEHGEIVHSGEIIFRTDQIKEAVCHGGSDRKKTIPHVRYIIKLKQPNGPIPYGMDVRRVGDFNLSMPETRLFATYQEVEKEIKEWEKRRKKEMS